MDLVVSPGKCEITKRVLQCIATRREMGWLCIEQRAIDSIPYGEKELF